MAIFRRKKNKPTPDPRKVAFEQAMERLGHPISTEQILDDYLTQVIGPHEQLQRDADLLAIADTVGVTR